MGRFVSRDPICAEANLLVYSSSDPTNSTDFFGLDKTRTTIRYSSDDIRILIKRWENEDFAKETIHYFETRVGAIIRGMGSEVVEGTADCPPGQIKIGEYVSRTDDKFSIEERRFRLAVFEYYDFENGSVHRIAVVDPRGIADHWTLKWSAILTLKLTKMVTKETIKPRCIEIWKPKLPKLPKLKLPKWPLGLPTCESDGEPL